MGKGRAPDSFEMYLLNKDKDRYIIDRLSSMETRIENRMEITGESFDVALSRIKYNDTHQND